MLFGVLKACPETLWTTLFVATIGYILGGMVTFGMGWLLPQRWVPLIGAVLCLAAGWLRLNPWQAALFMAIMKFARYGLLALAVA